MLEPEDALADAFLFHASSSLGFGIVPLRSRWPLRPELQSISQAVPRILPNSRELLGSDERMEVGGALCTCLTSTYLSLVFSLGTKLLDSCPVSLRPLLKPG